MHELHHHQHGDGTQQYNKDGQAGEDPGPRLLEGEVGESGRCGDERGNRQHDFQIAFHFELQRKIGPTREFEPAASAKKGGKEGYLRGSRSQNNLAAASEVSRGGCGAACLGLR